MTEKQDIGFADIAKHLRYLEEERARLKNCVVNTTKYAIELTNMAQRLTEIAAVLDPYKTHKSSTPRSPRFKYKEALDTLTQSLQSGNIITVPLLKKMYPDQAESVYGYMIQKLKLLPRIKARYEGRAVHLYMGD